MKFIKLVASYVVIKGYEYKMIGSMWEFKFQILRKKGNLLKFDIYVGFGERTKPRFSFLNILRKRNLKI